MLNFTVTWLLLPWLLFPSLLILGTQQANVESSNMYTRDPIPWVFQLGQSYPNREETAQCRPIRLKITRNSRLYITELVNNTSQNIQFQTADARLMTSRMKTKLNSLADIFKAKYDSKLLVLQSWTDSSNATGSDSLHNEGEFKWQMLWLQLMMQKGYF